MSVVIYLLCCLELWPCSGWKSLLYCTAVTLQLVLPSMSFGESPVVALFSSYTTTQGPAQSLLKTGWITYSLELLPSVRLSRGRIGRSVIENWLSPALSPGTYLSALLQADVCISGWSCSFKYNPVCGIFVVITFCSVVYFLKLLLSFSWVLPNL